MDAYLFKNHLLLIFILTLGSHLCFAGFGDFIGNWLEDVGRRKLDPAFFSAFGVPKPTGYFQTNQTISYSDGIYLVNGTSPYGKNYYLKLNTNPYNKESRYFGFFKGVREYVCEINEYETCIQMKTIKEEGDKGTLIALRKLDKGKLVFIIKHEESGKQSHMLYTKV